MLPWTLSTMTTLTMSASLVFPSYDYMCLSCRMHDLVCMHKIVCFVFVKFIHLTVFMFSNMEISSEVFNYIKIIYALLKC